MGSGPARNGRGGGNENYGTLYGREISGEDVARSEKDFEISFLINNGEWPEKNRNIQENQVEQQIYLNLMFTEKAKALHIEVPDSAVEDAASQILRSPSLTRLFGSSGEPVPATAFVEHLLKPKGFTDADFEHCVRHQLLIEQLRMTLGLSGSLVTPQEAAALYDREHQEVTAQAVFFSATNYLPQVTTTPGEIGEFFTNNMAYYRVPDRLQVNYVWFNLTNYLAGATAALTNLNDLVEANYKKYAASEQFKGLTPEQGKSKIRSLIIRQRALSDAADKAKGLRDAVFAAEPVKPENLATLAQKMGFEAKLSAPFAQQGISAPDFANAPAVERTAFTLTADSPFSDLIGGEDGIYLIGLANQLPSAVPPFAEIGARVQDDFRMQKAIALAYSAGTNFYFNAAVQLAVGKSFPQIAVAAGHAPVLLSPFSLSSADVPEAGDRADIRDLKNAAFTTPVGGISRFVPTQDGGFILHVQSLTPADPARKAADLPQFISQMRRGRENEAFSIWVNSEANREFRNIAAFQKPQPGAANQP